MSGQTTHNRPAIAIMAGGESRRMGRDKAALELDGKTLLDGLIDEALAAGDTVAVIGRTGERDDVTWLEDEQTGLGPIGGLKTALTHLDRPVVLVACDMPRVDRDALAWLIDAFTSESGLPGSDGRARCPGSDGVAVTRDGQLEPLFSVYSPNVLPLIAERIAHDRLSVRRLIEAGDFEQIEAPAGVADKLTNVNTPEEFERLR